MEKLNKFSALREQEKIARQNILIDAAENAFSKKPFNRVTMKDIAREAGINPATIYRYFPDQQTLFIEAFIRNSRRINDEISEILSKKDNASIEDITETFLQYVVENNKFFRMMTYYLLDGSLNKDLFIRINRESRSFIDQFEKFFSNIDTALDSRVLAQSLYAAMNGILLTFHSYPGKDEKEIRTRMVHAGRIIARLFTIGLNSNEMLDLIKKTDSSATS